MLLNDVSLKLKFSMTDKSRNDWQISKIVNCC